ncbi:MAG: SusC/RagA family TonB-linked outer membrane protein [Candidatus Dadabacteria bacterium]
MRRTALSSFPAEHVIFRLLRMFSLSAFVLAISLQAMAHSVDQTVTINVKDVSVKRVFKEIQKQTGLNIFIDEAVLSKTGKVTLNVRNKPVAEVINMCLPQDDYSFVIIDGTIIIKEKTVLERYSVNPGEEPPPPIDIHGRVVNENNDPVEGVTVTVKGTRKATSTNADGEYTLNGVNENAVLVFSGVNVEAYEVAVNNRREIAVTLKTRVVALGDITVSANTGYQTISRERSTGSFNVISREQLEKPTTNIAQRLIGTTSGLQGRLDVNGNPTFEIRGLTSLYANSQPLVVVDGFPIQGDFNSVNPNDVESVTILKDAAAASIWGARSANGVIVIVTRNAKKNIPLKIEFNAFSRIGSKFDLDYVRPLASSAQTVDYEKIAYTNWRTLQNPNSLQDNSFSFSQAGTALNEANFGYITAAERDARLEALKQLDNKSQISDYLLTNPVNTQYNLNLYGGSDKMSNSLSLMFEKNQSNFKKSGNDRYMVNYRTNMDVAKWLGFNLSGMLLNNKIDNSGVSLSDIQNMSPYDMLVNADGSLTNINQYYWPIMQRLVPMSKFPYTDWTYNPVQEIENRSFTSEQLNARIQAGLTFKILNGLSIDTKGQYELFNTFGRNLYGDNTFYVRSRVNQATTWNQTVTPNTFTMNLPKGSILEQSRSKGYSYNWRNQLNFNRSFGSEHEINFIGGEEINNLVTQGFGYPTSYGYNDQTLAVGIFPNGPGGTFLQIKNWMGSNQTFSYTNSFSYRTERYFSLYGNGSYTYDRKYTLSGSYRTDASNLITDDPKYRYSPFWSVGGAWQLYKENFMRSIDWLNRLNLRVTYGFNGNVDRSTSFRPLIATSGTPNVYTGDFTASVSSFGNPTLRWEKTGTWNVGFDYAVLKNKLFGKIDVYSKHGKDLIAQLSIPAINGTTTQKLNNAAMTNEGVELEIGTNMNISRSVNWRGNLNFSYNKNKITNLFVASYPASTLIGGGTGAYVVGENANTIWRFQYAGVINNQPQVVGAKGATYDFGAFTPGDGREYLLNMGTTVAPYVLGFVNAFQVKDFNLSFIVTGKFGHVFQRLGFNYPPTWTSRVLPNSKLSEVMNGDPSQVVPLPLNTNEPRYYFWDRFHQYMNYLIESASHLRMQEVNLTYTLPRPLLSKVSMSRMQLYVQGNDLFTVYANNAAEDPEYPLGTMKPRPKFTFGLRCEF